MIVVPGNILLTWQQNHAKVVRQVTLLGRAIGFLDMIVVPMIDKRATCIVMIQLIEIIKVNKFTKLVFHLDINADTKIVAGDFPIGPDKIKTCFKMVSFCLESRPESPVLVACLPMARLHLHSLANLVSFVFLKLYCTIN